MENLDQNFDLINGPIEDWARMLNLFSKASGLTASLYTPEGKLIAGPFAGSVYGEYLLSSKSFESDKAIGMFQSQNVIKMSQSHHFIEEKFEEGLTVRFLPIKVENTILAVIVFGWVFDHFPDPIEASRISKTLKEPETSFWQASRILAPVSLEKIKSHESMLELLCTTLIQQLVYVNQANHNARLKDELLAIVSHELKTPLTSILLRIQMLKRNTVRPENMHQFALSLESSAKIQARLIDDLLDAAKVITGKFSLDLESLNLATITKDAADTIEDSAVKKNIKIMTEGLEGDYPFMGDGARLRQAFWNILSNSVKFTPHGGLISIKITQNISKYVIRMSDNGTGIDATFLPFIFAKFSQHESKIGLSNSGLGLGLSLVKTIIEMHQGSIEVESSPTLKGTTFEISLPRTAV